MAFIRYEEPSKIDPADRVSDQDNILRIHGIHSKIMRLHHDFYLQLMHRKNRLSRVQREMMAVVVSAANGCHY